MSRQGWRTRNSESRWRRETMAGRKCLESLAGRGLVLGMVMTRSWPAQSMGLSKRLREGTGERRVRPVPLPRMNQSKSKTWKVQIASTAVTAYQLVGRGAAAAGAAAAAPVVGLLEVRREEPRLLLGLEVPLELVVGMEMPVVREPRLVTAAVVVRSAARRSPSLIA